MTPLSLIKTSCLTLLLLLLGACAALLTPKVESEVAELRSGQYRLDKSHATVLFKISHMGLSTYVGRFNEFDASLDFNAQDLPATQLDAVIEMGSLDINDADLKSDLLGGKWLATSTYPQAVFSTRSVKPSGDNQFEFTGDLNWRGVTHPIQLDVVFHGGANNILTGKYTLGFSATGRFLRSDFGMDAYIPLVGDEIHIEAFAEFQRSSN